MTSNYTEWIHVVNVRQSLITQVHWRESIWKYKDVIRSYHKKKTDFIKIEQTSSKDPSTDNKIASRLVEKLSPYNERDFKIIISRAFLSAHIREILFEWEKDPSKPINITEASNEVIDNLKFEYPKLKKWDNSKIINRISNNWGNRDQIQADLNREVLEHSKSTDLKQREEMNPVNIIEIAETNANNEILESMLKENSETLNWNKVLPITRYMNEAPPMREIFVLTR